jgi:hypothetical protein
VKAVSWALMILSAVAMSGCGGGGDGESSQSSAVAAEPAPTPAPPTPAPPTPAPPPPAPPSNQAPTISGTAPSAVNADGAYAFVPAASDAEGDTLTFSIQNKPSWASFVATTGELSGTPGAADIGTYSDISISVSDGETSSTLASFSIAVTTMSLGSVTVSWSPPTQNTDGTPLTDLSGYRIRYGTNAAALTHTVSIDNAGMSTYVVEGLAPATWYFAVTAVTSSGAESALSNVANKTI